MKPLGGENIEGAELIPAEISPKLPWYKSNKYVAIAVKIAIETANFRLLCQNLKFTLICMSTFCIFFAYFVPFVFLPIRAEKLVGEKYIWVISVIGKLSLSASHSSLVSLPSCCTITKKESSTYLLGL